MSNLAKELFQKRKSLLDQIGAVDLLLAAELKLLVDNVNHEALEIKNINEDDYPYTAGWREKILFILDKSGEKGVYTSDIIQQLRRYENQEPLGRNRQVSENGISTILQNMEQQHKEIKVVRQNNGRKLHYSLKHSGWLEEQR